MPSLERFFDPQIRKFDLNVKPLPGARFYFFENGTTTPKTVYQDKAGTIPHTNPVIADASGSFAPIFLDGLYRVELRSNKNIVQPGWPIDNVGQDAAVVPFGPWVEILPYNEGEIVTGSNGNWYRSIGDNNLGNDPTTSPAEWEVIPTPVASSFTSNKAYLTWSDDGEQISLDVDIDGLGADVLPYIEANISSADGNFIVGGTLGVSGAVELGDDLEVDGTVTLTNALALTSGGTGAINAADARDNLELGTASLVGYSSQLVALNGDFNGSSSIKCVRIGDLVTITLPRSAMHISSSSPSTLNFLIPTMYRPTDQAGNVFYMYTSPNLIASISILAEGSVSLNYTDFSGATVPRTSPPSHATISYIV